MVDLTFIVLGHRWTDCVVVTFMDIVSEGLADFIWNFWEKYVF